MRNYTHVLTIIMIDDPIGNANIEGIDSCVHSFASNTVVWALNTNNLNVTLSR